MRPVQIGCSGWNYDDWRGRFYPQGLAQRDWLGRYAEQFRTVEVNSTFYRLPNRDAVARWVEATPDDFVFAIKASRYLTHRRGLRDLGQGPERYYERIEPLHAAGKLGPVVWQRPPNFGRMAPCASTTGAAAGGATIRTASWRHGPGASPPRVAAPRCSSI